MARQAQGKDAGEKNAAVNRRARHEFEIEERFEAGIALLGSEVKSLRDGAVTLGDGYIATQGDDLMLLNVHISEYANANRHNHEPMRPRKLLLHRKEIEHIAEAIQEKGRTAVPLRIYFKHGLAKLEIGLGRGKRTYDKRHDLKERDAKREMDRARAEND
ncbi:MAG: SsrA-binding protein [Deltaproteobacteria bacterium HGW-Deltaproteobacteria-14]|nr:MAG: SsrA-binding protein [Deltaproteobacteria bacterium HGW-Deltaproteobacteria-14]